MNTKQQVLPIFLWMLGLIVALSVLIALGYNQITFAVVPALKAVTVSVFGH